jgi:pilus assembly protein FimV
MRVLAAALLAWASATALAENRASVVSEQGSYVAARGDTLFGIARKLRPVGASVHQMVLALYRANPDAFAGGDINRLLAGAVLSVPDRSAVLAVSPPEAARQVASLSALRALPTPAPVATPTPAEPSVTSAARAPEAPAALAPPRRPAPGLLDAQEAERRYRVGLAMERAGDERGALQAFLEAGESGHGLAQKKLGEIYDRGNSATSRDYQTALRWYQKAREQGIEVPKPETRAPAIR